MPMAVIRVFFNNGTVAAGNWAGVATVDNTRTPTDSPLEPVRTGSYPIFLASTTST